MSEAEERVDGKPHDEAGVLRPEFVEAVETAVNERDRAELKGLVDDLHEADLGRLLESMEPGRATTPSRCLRTSTPRTSGRSSRPCRRSSARRSSARSTSRRTPPAA